MTLVANSSRFSFADVVLVPFPFTDQPGTKKRPAVVVSSHDYNASRRDIVIMAITDPGVPLTTIKDRSRVAAI